ncbi:MAG: hypothetical protein JXR83_01265 [Deltaproteobacteria bacterium]|nr:hypothetical protein [Deltaproteobacteria bacterium]
MLTPFPLSEKFLTTLWERGLLVERDETRTRLSNNRHGRDRDFLCRQLEQLGLRELFAAFMTRNGLPLDQLESALRARFEDGRAMQRELEPQLFEPRHYSEETADRWGSDDGGPWGSFAARRHGFKVDVAHLDVDIAALVKSFNAAGITTGSSCAGFVSHMRTPYIWFVTTYDRLWAQAIIESFGLEASWRDDHQLLLPCRASDQVRGCALCLARPLYANRVVLRDLKQVLVTCNRPAETAPLVLRQMRDVVRLLDEPPELPGISRWRLSPCDKTDVLAWVDPPEKAQRK